jgi:hypothetical protein
MNTYQTDIAPWFLTGFAERESSFTYSRSRRGLALYFALRSRAADAPLLQRIQTFLGGAGRIYSRRRRASETGGSASSASAYFRVTRIDELMRVVSHFDLYPMQGTKRTSFEVWREMVLLKAGPESADADQMNLLAAQLSSLTARGRYGAPL